MSALDRLLTGLLVVGASIWLGGLVSIPVVGRIVRSTLSPADRVTFFQRFGRFHGVVGTGALILALITGGLLLRGRAWDGVQVAAVVCGLVLVLALAIGMAQARRMTRLRRRLVSAPTDLALSAQVTLGSRVALGLRLFIVVVSVALLVLAVLLIG